jgi:hypothetical protein
MSVAQKNRKLSQLRLINEVDDLIMEGWSEDLSLGETLDSMPAELRNAFLRLKFNTPVIDGDGNYTIQFRI